MSEAKVVVVTGASSGIGRAISRQLADQGDKIVLIARDEKRLLEVEREIGENAFAIQADVTDRKAVEAAYQAAHLKFGKIDSLVANAGVFTNIPFVETSDELIDRMLDVNVGGVMRCIKSALQYLTKNEYSDIVVVSSVAGIVGHPRAAVYAATKSGIQAFSHILRREMRGTGVRIGTICPGTVSTDIWKDLLNSEELAQKAENNEILEPDDVARAIVFMLSQPRHCVVRDLVLLPQSQDS